MTRRSQTAATVPPGRDAVVVRDNSASPRQGWLRNIGRGAPRLLLGHSMLISASLFTGGAAVLDYGGSSGLSRATNQVGWLVLVAGCVWFFVRSGRSNELVQDTALKWAFLGVFASQLLSSVFAGQLLSVNVFLPPLLATVMMCSHQILSWDAAVRALQLATMLPVVASLAAFATGQSWAVGDSSRRIPAPFITGRLNGVIGHPNGLAPIAAMALLLTVFRPSRFRMPLALLAGWVLLATDTRTMIIGAPVAIVVAVLERRRPVGGTRVLGLATTLGVGAFLLLAPGPLGSIFGGRDLETLNGRTVVWAEAVRYWHTSPWVGVGANAFDRGYRLRTGLTYAGQAHNQFLQTLAGEGALGLAVLVAACFAIVRRSIRKRSVTNGVSVGIAVLFLFNLFTESPLRVGRWSPGLLTLAVLLFVCSTPTSKVRA